MGVLRLLAVAVAMFAAGCSDPPPTPSSGVGGAGGAGGAHDAAGGQASDGAPVIESLTSDVTLVTALGGDVVFTAVVSDPQGLADIAGGRLLYAVSADGVADFIETGVPGGYQLRLTIDGSAWPEQGYRIFLATFTDLAGHVAERSTAVEFDIGGCTTKPDRPACRACFCEAEPVGCASFTSFEYQHLYCGQSCAATCGAFCQSVSSGTPDPGLIDGACAACQPSADDVDAFEDGCLAVIPHCFEFLVDVYNCPR